ncbi:MAG: TonB family protein [Acidobacteria bacterium]|nr:TonB family protein [Acidobacteriota bacterium]
MSRSAVIRDEQGAVSLQPCLSSRPEERLRSFVLSLGLHVVLVAVLVSVDLPGRPSAFKMRTAEDLLADSQIRVTLFTPREELPAVTPTAETAKRVGAKQARERFRQKIIADDPNPQSLRQKIIGAPPDIKIEHDIPSPNLLAWNAPQVNRLRFQIEPGRDATPRREALRPEAAPELQPLRQAVPDLPAAPGPRLRFQYERRAESAPARQALAPEAAPELRAAAAKVDLANLHQPPLLRYWAPEIGPQAAPAKPALPNATAPNLIAGRQTVDLGTIQQQPRLRYQSWADKPAAPKRGALTPGEAAPLINGSDGLGGSGSAAGVAALAGRDSLAETVKAGFAATKTPPAADGPNSLIVGLDPDPNAVPAIPVGSRRGRFSASPDGGPGGGDLMIASAATASLRTPNLSIQGSALAEPRALIQRKRQDRPGSLGPGISPLPAKDTAALSLFDRRASVRDIGLPPVIDPDIDVRSKNPEILFLNREVFVLAVNTPNVTSYSGSWVIRFAERRLGTRKRDKSIESDQKDDPTRGKLSAPGPKHKVDPKYIRTAADEGVEGTVTLYAVIRTDGTVRGIELVESVDERLDASAIAALAQWQFEPATRLGVPVEVDVLVDIPFRLEPPEERAKRVIRRF